jgi:hypothetical protein
LSNFREKNFWCAAKKSSDLVCRKVKSLFTAEKIQHGTENQDAAPF